MAIRWNKKAKLKKAREEIMKMQEEQMPKLKLARDKVKNGEILTPEEEKLIKESEVVLNKPASEKAPRPKEGFEMAVEYMRQQNHIKGGEKK